MSEHHGSQAVGRRAVLTVEELTVEFDLRRGPFKAVDRVGFRIAAGETLCVVGESGSGKSVTARAIMQLVAPPGRIVGGRVLLDRPGGVTDLAALDPRGSAIRAVRGGEVAMIFQEPMSSLSPVHTIGFQIVEALRLHLRLDRHTARERAIELLGRVDIAEPERAVDRYTFEYSGGMRQRAMIAMALAGEPRVLIADEPTTALDVTTQAEILRLIRRLQRETGLAVLFITHDLGVVAEIADEVAVMRRGRVVDHGPATRIFAAPGHDYTVRLLSAVRKLERHAEARAASQADEDDRPVLEATGLAKTFPIPGSFLGRRKGYEVRAVAGISFALRRGRTLGIVGESGSGKTTLARLMLRILEPTAGDIRYRDAAGSVVDVRGLDGGGLRRFRRDVRMIFQDPFGSLNPRMTVRDVVGDPLIVHGIARGRALRDRVAELLRQVGMPPEAMERFPHAFSGGQRQRIGIARALALDPRVIIADEATSALDVSLRSQILDLLLELQGRLGFALMVITHDVSVVRYVCDRVAVMRKGEIVEEGETDQVLDHPRHPYSQALISAVPASDPGRRHILGGL